jgi:aquaporin Z
MGSTAILIIYSPWGKQSGAHINPSTTLTFLRLGKVAKWDALFYILAQFGGGTTGALLASTVLAAWVSHPSVNYVITMPGSAGTAAAFLGEVVITFILMRVILRVSNNSRLHKLTGVCAGALVAAYITLEAPISGMSMNPARTLASAVPAQYWTALWPPPRSTCEAGVRVSIAPNCITKISSAVYFAANPPPKRSCGIAYRCVVSLSRRPFKLP